MPRVDSLPQAMIGRCAILIDGSWYLPVARIGTLGIVGCAGVRCRRIFHPAPNLISAEILESDSVTFLGAQEYDSFRPVLRRDSEGGHVADPLVGELADDGSLGAYVGERRMLAQAPKRTKGKRRK